MNPGVHNLKSLISKLKTISFLARLFQWKSIRTQLIDAAADLEGLAVSHETLVTEKQNLQTSFALANKDLQLATENYTQCRSDIAVLREKISALQTELNTSKDIQRRLLQEEENRKEEHARALTALQTIQQAVKADRQKEIEDRQQLEIERLVQMKETWNRHEEYVKQVIKNISSRHVIEYLDTVPFTGNPDNTLKICDEFVIFDAKSPGGNDLKNFPAYLKDQAEKAKKYAKQENVKTDIFFVIPAITLDSLNTFVHRLGDYTVYIVTADALEPLILNLKRIEEYEFAKELRPEDRENICRIIGKFGHLAKRRIQVDNFFAKQFIQLAYKCEADLPADMIEQVIGFEKSEKLNPPVEKRAKAINIRELGHEIARLKEEAAAKGVHIDDDAMSSHLNEFPLYKTGNKDR